MGFNCCDVRLCVSNGEGVRYLKLVEGNGDVFDTILGECIGEYSKLICGEFSELNWGELEWALIKGLNGCDVALGVGNGEGVHEMKLVEGIGEDVCDITLGGYNGEYALLKFEIDRSIHSRVMIFDVEDYTQPPPLSGGPYRSPEQS